MPLGRGDMNFSASRATRWCMAYGIWNGERGGDWRGGGEGEECGRWEGVVVGGVVVVIVVVVVVVVV